MKTLIEFISQPWHWSISGVMIVIVMYLLLWFGGRFGVSSNLRTLCTIGGASRFAEYFKFDWKSQSWNLVFILGAVIGGFIAVNFLQSPDPVQISQGTIERLGDLGITAPVVLEDGRGYVPNELYRVFSLRNILLLVAGGIFIGFGTRYGNGCTSGHSISGLSNFQLSSLVATIGFFIGGLITTWFLLPLILN